MAIAEYADLDATALAQLVRAREVRASELVEEAIARAEALNPALNALVCTMYDHARAAAAALDDGGRGDAPFAGVPFLMKDFCAEVAGVPFTEASAFLRGYVPREDSELYRRFCAAGLLTLGKTNLPELAIGATTEPRLFGPARNPWDTARTTGGSSGGAAAAVAARIVPAAHGNDVGGSIRIPASCCGLVGLKPSRGRGTTAPHYGDLLAGFFVEHVLTRSVRDSAAMLDAIAAPAPGDPYFAPPPARPFAEVAARAPAPLRIAFSDRTPAGDPVHPDCAQAVHAAARLLESLGHAVEEAQPDYDVQRLWTGFTRLMACGAAWAMADWARRLGREPAPEHFEPFVWAFAEQGRKFGAADYLLAMQDVQREVRALARTWERYDVLVTPTLGQPPVELGTLVFTGDPFELRRRTAAFSPYTYVSNASGQPALSLPLHWNDDGLPIGVQLVGRYPEDATLLQLAAQLERAAPWQHRRPEIAG